MKKAGTVALVGRPNVGKSTLLNNIIGRKVTITSPKPQTTRFSIQAVYEDERGQIIFIDTPGIFAKVEDPLSKKINKTAEAAFKKEVDLIVYLIDHTRYRDTEENKTLGLVRKLKIPKILVINKIDIRKPTYIEQYLFLEDEFDTIIKISALKKTNLKQLTEKIFAELPQSEMIIDTKNLVQPALNLDSKTFIAEIIREKAYLRTRQEVPYTLTVVVEEITERKNGVVYIRAKILTNADRYRQMIIGQKGSKIKEIGTMARKELELASDKKVFLDLTVETDPHWIERMV